MRFLIKGTGHDAFQSQSALQNLLQIGVFSTTWIMLEVEFKKKKMSVTGCL